MNKTRKIERSRLALYRETLHRLTEDRLADVRAAASNGVGCTRLCLTPHSCDRTCTC